MGDQTWGGSLEVRSSNAHSSGGEAEAQRGIRGHTSTHLSNKYSSSTSLCSLWLVQQGPQWTELRRDGDR